MPLDIVTTNTSGLVRIRGGVEYTHNDLNDTSVFEQFGQVRKVPLQAMVERAGLFDADAIVEEPRPMSGHFALYNPVQDSVLDARPVTSSYQLVPHDELFATHAAMTQDDGRLPCNDVEIVDRLYDDGAKAHRTVYFNDLQADIGAGDNVRCRLDVFNSVEMSWAFQVFSGAYRDLCRNTLVFGGQKAYQQKRKHTKNLDVRAMVKKSLVGLDAWTSQRALMDKWRGVALSPEQFGNVLAATICKVEDRAAEVGQADGVNRRLMNYLLHRFDEEQTELGRTMWAGYNALTHWSTHTNERWTDIDTGKEYQTGKKTARADEVTRKRSASVSDVLSSASWQSIEGVAA